MIDYYIQTECRKLRLHLCTLLQKILVIICYNRFFELILNVLQILRRIS